MKPNFFYSAFIAAFILSLASCTKDSTEVAPCDFEPIGDVITMSRDFVVASTTRALDKKLRLTASFDTKTEKVLEFNIYQIEGDIARDLGISQEELDQALIKELGENYTDMAALEQSKAMATADNFTLSGCLKGCRAEFTNADGSKKPGRGGCKVTCWIERIMVFCERIVDVF